ncbi:MAG: RpiB/LacA/LacB family sugar-phosphate isomerase [Candidatus Nomurabacteria bacterium]|nr:RpiB/LacA/LacB family sugar-phosphate isomerase [Candidatus Nomurabacteria bacterium]
MKIYIGADHAGYELKEKLKTYLGGLKYEVIDKGAFTLDPSDDYPTFIHPVAESVAGDETSRGIVLGGSGQGEAIDANRVKKVRACEYYGGTSEVVRVSREHNNANILSIGARFVTEDQAKEAVKVFLETEASNDERHIRRNNELDK